MGMIALLIILVVLVGAIRRGMTDSALPEPGKPPTDTQNPFNPPGAPLTVADAMEPSHPPADMVALRRLGSAMEGLGAVLPLGNQGAWTFGPPPPAAELEPAQDGHRVELAPDELERLAPPEAEDSPLVGWAERS